jgi:hypothetical protein
MNRKEKNQMLYDKLMYIIDKLSVIPPTVEECSLGLLLSPSRKYYPISKFLLKEFIDNFDYCYISSIDGKLVLDDFEYQVSLDFGLE